jgi:hypothetical protein
MSNYFLSFQVDIRNLRESVKIKCISFIIWSNWLEEDISTHYLWRMEEKMQIDWGGGGVKF